MAFIVLAAAPVNFMALKPTAAPFAVKDKPALNIDVPIAIAVSGSDTIILGRDAPIFTIDPVLLFQNSFFFKKSSFLSLRVVVNIKFCSVNKASFLPRDPTKDEVSIPFNNIWCLTSTGSSSCENHSGPLKFGSSLATKSTTSLPSDTTGVSFILNGF